MHACRFLCFGFIYFYVSDVWQYDGAPGSLPFSLFTIAYVVKRCLQMGHDTNAAAKLVAFGKFAEAMIKAL